MIKKATSHFLLIVFALSMLNYTVSAEISFADLMPEHWAYSYVKTLAEDGTVKGFEDGEFKPNATVSRAEFVKMIGKGTERRQMDFNDVNASHWGYEYIMFSGLEGSGNNFNPDTAIKRDDVLNLIWKRNGSKTGIIAPSVITGQSSNKDAAAWGYTYGIMTGDDGVNLRLSDTLTRAEAAALIVRSRAINDNSPKLNFIDKVSPKILEVIFNSIKLFDGIAYDENKTITNGEMARAAVRLGSEEFNLTYTNYETSVPFEHPYAMDLNAIGNSCLGADKVNKDFIDKPSNVKDTLTAFTYNIIKKSREGAIYGDTGDLYKDISKADTEIMDICLTFAKKNGIQLYSDGTIKPDKEITLKELACILLQLDNLIGSQSAFTTDYIGNFQIAKNSKISSKIDSYPANYADYQLILDNMPNEIYTTPFSDNTKNNLPKDSYDFSREYSFIFINMLKEIKSSCENGKNIKIRMTYYPSLVCDNGNGATLRIKCEIIKNPDNLALKDIFGDYMDIENVPHIPTGSAFYADIVTGQSISDIILSSELASIKQIVFIS